MINDAFNEIYTSDPKLRQLLGENAATLKDHEKRQILIAYREKGGIEGMLEEEDPEPSFIIHEGKRYDRV
jgi:hypothetical protein